MSEAANSIIMNADVAESMMPAENVDIPAERKLRKERNMRNHVEGKFGQGKNAYELSRIRARRQDTSESWISAIFLVMNLMRWLKIQPAIIWLIISQILWWLVIFSPEKAQYLCPNGQRGWQPELIPVRKQLNELH